MHYIALYMLVMHVCVTRPYMGPWGMGSGAWGKTPFCWDDYTWDRKGCCFLTRETPKGKCLTSDSVNFPLWSCKLFYRPRCCLRWRASSTGEHIGVCREALWGASHTYQASFRHARRGTRAVGSEEEAPPGLALMNIEEQLAPI